MKNLLTSPTRCLLVRPAFLENTFYDPSSVLRRLGAARLAAHTAGVS